MGILNRVFGQRRAPVGALKVCDPSRLNWLYVTYNTVEELVRVSPAGWTVPAAMKAHKWADPRTLEVTVRPGNRFSSGEAVTARTVVKAFDEVMRWKSPHPPGTQFNQLAGTTCEAVSEMAVRFRLPTVDGAALGKLRAMHLMSAEFWVGPGFGYARNGTGEGRW